MNWLSVVKSPASLAFSKYMNNIGNKKELLSSHHVSGPNKFTKMRGLLNIETHDGQRSTLYVISIVRGFKPNIKS